MPRSRRLPPNVGNTNDDFFAPHVTSVLWTHNADVACEVCGRRATSYSVLWPAGEYHTTCAAHREAIETRLALEALGAA